MQQIHPVGRGYRRAAHAHATTILVRFSVARRLKRSTEEKHSTTVEKFIQFPRSKSYVSLGERT